MACDSRISSKSESMPEELRTRSAAERKMIFGALWCIGGILVTGATYVAASGPGGGTYFVAWGAIVFGAIRFFSGLSGRNEQTDSEDVGYDALEAATKLETEGRVQEAIALYETIAQNYPDKPAGHDAQKSLESLREKVE